MVKRFIIFLCATAAVAAPVPHAVLTPDLQLIERFEDIDAGLVVTYRADPAKSNKVARYRLLVVPAQPVPTLQQTVEPAGTNLNDGGYSLDSTTVTRVWNLRNLTAQEIAEINASTASDVSAELDLRTKANNWEQFHLRLLSQMAEMHRFAMRIFILSGLYTNLTVPERQRANAISNEVAELYSLRQWGRTNYQFVLSNSVVVVPPTNWPNVVIDE